MQSKTNFSTPTKTQPISIPDLVVMIEASGWKSESKKPFYFTFSKGKRSLVLMSIGQDWTLICKDIDPDGQTLMLPSLSKINPFPLMITLKAYGIVSLMMIATENEIDIHSLFNAELGAAVPCT